MSVDYKQRRPGTARYKSNKTGEEWWLTPSEAAPWLERGDIRPITSVEEFKKDAAELAQQLLKAELAEQVFGRSLLAKRRNFEPEALASFIWDQCNRSKELHPGKTTKEYMYEKWGSSWGTSEKAALAENSGVTGGYGVPWEIAEPLGIAIAQTGIFRQCGAFSLPMQSDEMLVPNPVTTTTAGVPNWFGGMVFSWTAESQTRTETEPVFKAASLKLWELSGYLTASGPIINDAPALSAFLRKGIPSAVAWQEDFAFLNGTGAGQPQGILARLMQF